MDEFRKKYGKPVGLVPTLLMPVVGIICAAVLILFSISSLVPGQFAGRHFQIPFWGAAVAGMILVGMVVMRFRAASRNNS